MQSFFLKQTDNLLSVLSYPCNRYITNSIIYLIYLTGLLINGFFLQDFLFPEETKNMEDMDDYSTYTEVGL